jgi:hypothetical protein
VIQLIASCLLEMHDLDPVTAIREMPPGQAGKPAVCRWPASRWPRGPGWHGSLHGWSAGTRPICGSRTCGLRWQR